MRKDAKQVVVAERFQPATKDGRESATRCLVICLCVGLGLSFGSNVVGHRGVRIEAVLGTIALNRGSTNPFELFVCRLP